MRKGLKMADEKFQDYIPPQNLEAEQAVLGSIFRTPNAIIEAMEYVEPIDFYRRNHQLIFQAMVDLNENDSTIDALTIANQLDKKGQLEDVGGRQYLAELAVSAPTSRNISFYAQIVEEKSTLRRLIQASDEIAKKSYAQTEDIADIIDEAERRILQVAGNRNSEGFQHIGRVIQDNLVDINQLFKNDEQITGLSTGYTELDSITAGLHPDELVIIAARPGVGKTAFALNLAQNIGTNTNETVAIFSLEMSSSQLVNRMLCAEGTIDANHLRTGQLSDEEWDNLVIAAGSLSEANIYIDDTPGIRTAEIRAKCRRLAKENNGLGLIVIDYLQLIEGGGRNENRQQEVSEISRQLKRLAKELSVPVVALSQLSRSVEARQDKRPILSDLRESGSIEQDADIVGFLYREDYYRNEDDEEDDSARDNIVEVIIEKNRSGARGTVELLFLKEYNKFSSISYIPDEAAPPVGY